MKWLKPPPQSPSAANYITSECGKWIINKAGTVYMLVALHPSRIVCVGSLQDCKSAASRG